MKKNFSSSWNRSKQPRKQRKYRFNAPLHIKQKFAHSTLSEQLRKKYGRRSLGVKKGDKVKVMRGQFRKHEAKVERVDLKNERVYVEGVEFPKKDGTKRKYPLHASNLMITELNSDDKMRKKAIERGKQK